MLSAAVVTLGAALLAVGATHAARPARACPGLPGASRDPAADLTGKANDLERVRRVKDRYERAIFRHCRAVVGFGIGKRRHARRPASPSDKDYVIVVYLRSPRYLPRNRRIFLAGVPLVFRVTGPIRAL